MKVLLLNGSPNAQGCTYTALSEVAGALEKNGIETEIVQIGKKPVSGCIACRACAKLSMTAREDLESKLPVGSSARIREGSPARALAMDTRCCCPPESWQG